MSFELRVHEIDPINLTLELLEGRSWVSVEANEDATVVQVGKVQMTVSRTGVRVVSREGPATGHASCHEVELWKGGIPA